MSITSNEGGVQCVLDIITSNEGGTIYELDTVHSNEGGTLYEIHSGAKGPKSLTWSTVSIDSGITDGLTVSNNGMECAASVDRAATENGGYPIYSNVFTITKETTISIEFSMTQLYTSGAGGCHVTDNSTGARVLAKSSSSAGSSFTLSGTLPPGDYYILFNASGGGQSGSGACPCSVVITFS